MTVTRAAAVRIAFCHYTADVCGGSDRSLFDLVTHLPRDRFDPTMILRAGDPLAGAYRAAGIAVHQVAFVPPRRALEIGKLVRFTAALLPTIVSVARVIRAVGADLVHVNTINNVQGAMAARLARRPLIWHIREIGTGSTVDRAMLGLVSRTATRAIAVSRAVAATLAACGRRLRVVPNGIDLAEYATLPTRQQARAQCELPANGPIVTVVGRLEPWKGQHVVLEALPAVLDAVPDVTLLLVGGPAVNKPEFEPALRAQAERLKLTGHVRFVGLRRDVPLLLAASDVLVTPTMTPEPFGRTLVEAMAAGLPVIATAGGGPLDIVADGRSGFLVPARDPEAIAEKLRFLLLDPACASRFGMEGRRRAAEHFGLGRLVAEMASLFDEVTDGQRAPAEHKVRWSRRSLLSSP